MKTPSRVALKSLAYKFMSQRLEIPEGASGNLFIEHEQKNPGDKLNVVSMREAIFTGLPVTDVILDKPYTIQWLKSKEDGTWMSDMPCELVQMWRELASHATGDVLVGGLGLGIVARMAALKKTVKSVTVIEKSPDVVKLVGSYLNHGTKVLTRDLFEFVEKLEPGQYQSALLDIWQGIGEWPWQTQVVPLRRAIGKKIKKVYCWQEQVMLNQVAQGLYRAADMDAEEIKCPSHCHWYAFRKGIIDLGYRTSEAKIKMTGEPDFQQLLQIEQANRNDERIRHAVQTFLLYVGDPIWEHFYGRYWDEVKPGKED